ncbi:MAG TPA: choice-of-anchor D domain-containing protein, partial [Kiritimatiellia bacterium]|nr:choice-of-anchor D domain-containing protein [Kiritimatiellia bacterium]
TSGVYNVTADVYHVRGIMAASYDIINGSGAKILANQPFTTWTSADGMSYRLSSAVRPGYWPATPSEDYRLQVTLMASNLLGHTNTLYTADGVATANELFISEYVEGTAGYNKAIEIFNGTTQPIQLNQYGIRLIENQKTWDDLGDYSQFPDQILEPGATFVIVHPQAGAALLGLANWTNAAICSFNGDDNVLLYKGAGEEFPVDALFAVPCPGNFYQDKTIRRSGAVTNANQTYDVTEWEEIGADVLDGLGWHDMDGARGYPMTFSVFDDDVDGPEIDNPLVNGVVPTDGAPGPIIPFTDISETGLPVSWQIQDVDSGIFAASNSYYLKRGLTVVTSSFVSAGTYVNGDGRDTPIPVSLNIPRELITHGDYTLGLMGMEYDPEWVGDAAIASNMYFFQVTAAEIVVTPSSLDFGQVGVGLMANQALTISNSGNRVLTVSNIVFAGTGHALFEADATELVIQPGTATNLVVFFTPEGGGTFNWTVTLHNDSANNGAVEIPLNGSCYDPISMAPEVIKYSITDSALTNNVVTDHAGAHGEIDVRFELYHITGMQANGASFDLLYPDGTLAVENAPLTMIGVVTNDAKECGVFTGVAS